MLSSWLFLCQEKNGEKNEVDYSNLSDTIMQLDLPLCSHLFRAVFFSLSSPTVQRAVQEVTATYGMEAASVCDSDTGFFEI